MENGYNDINISFFCIIIIRFPLSRLLYTLISNRRVVVGFLNENKSSI